MAGCHQLPDSASMTLARFLALPTLLQGAALAGLYVLTGLLSLDLSANDGLASMVWPPAGIALAAMLLGGNRFLPAIWLGSFIVVNVTSGSVLMALFSACGTTFAAWLARTAMMQLHPQDMLFDGLRSTLQFLSSAALVYPATSAGISALAQWLLSGMHSPPMHALATFGVWFFGDLMGILGLTPLLYLLGRRVLRLPPV